MPSTYSSNLLLELMADGEKDTLWGAITNENLEILGRAVSGVTTVSLAGTTHTLTVSQGALSEGHYAVLELGGSPTGTNTITINPNTVDRVYLVKNSSGQDAIFTQGSGGNVTVANGDTAIIYSDGAGASAKVTELTADFMRGSNNLSDIDSAATALTNLGLTATAAELNTLDGLTATTAELNKLDGLTSSTAELNILDGVTWTLTDYNTLTSTAVELNKLDGFTGTFEDLNYAKDLRATGVTTTEFDKLDGLSATTTELNYVSGVTSSIQTQLDGKAANTTQAEATWKTGTSTTETIVSPAKVKAAIDSINTNNRYESSWLTASYPVSVTHGLGQTPQFYQGIARCLVANNGYQVGDVVMLLPHADGDGARRKSSHADSTSVTFSQAPIGGSPTNALTNFSTPNWEIKIVALKELR